MVQCSQTGKQHNVKVKDLSRDDLEPLISEDLVVNEMIKEKKKKKSEEKYSVKEKTSVKE